MSKQTKHIDNSIKVPLSFERVEKASPLSDHVKNMVLNNIPQAYLGASQQPKVETEGITVLYSRLSSEDRNDGESNSIQNQKKLLEKYCRDNGYRRFKHYEDDGYSGTNFNRPGFQDMLSDIKAGKVARVICKDMSRFGRDYLQVGMFTDMLFPQLGVHFIAVSDGVDSTRGDNEFTAIRNIFNEMFARDTSKKIRATYQTRQRMGEHITSIPPYGYIKHPEDNKKWIVDEEAATIVQRIFSLCIEGRGPMQIAKCLKAQKILTPSHYMVSKGIPTPTKLSADPYGWHSHVISEMLSKLEYLGHTVNFKTHKPSYKEKKCIILTPDQWGIHENTQEPIIDEGTFLTVQNLRQVKRRRVTRMGEMGMFSGLLYCADCGGRMYMSRSRSYDPKLYHYVCSTYQKDRTLCTTHTIHTVVLEEVVLQNLRETIGYVSQHRDAFIEEVQGLSNRALERENQSRTKALIKAQNRIKELDGIFKRLYEDSIAGKITSTRFDKLSSEYETEQQELNASIKTLKAEIDSAKDIGNNAKHFVAVVDKYLDLQELTPEILNTFISKIHISAFSRKSKERELSIEYNFIGVFDFSEAIDEQKSETA